MDTATAGPSRLTRQYVVAGGETGRPVARDYGLIWLLALLGTLGLLFWSALITAFFAFL